MPRGVNLWWVNPLFFSAELHRRPCKRFYAILQGFNPGKQRTAHRGLKVEFSKVYFLYLCYTQLSVTMNKFEILKAAARITYGEYLGAWIYDTWQAYNEAYFSGTLEPGALEFGLTPHGHALGHYNPNLGRITLHLSLIKPKSARPWSIDKKYLGEKFAADVLLHEMIHQHLHQHHGAEYSKQDSHNGELWCNEINRLAAALQIDCPPAKPVIVRRDPDTKKVTRKAEAGYMARKDLATWPHPFRPKSYYL